MNANSASIQSEPAARPLAVVLASGGLDSCVTAAVVARDYDLAFFHANYGQLTVARELADFRDQAAHFRAVRTLEADLNWLGAIGGSSLTDTHLAVPDYELESPGLPSTYVPFRNTILLAAAVAWAEVLGAAAVCIGANEIDSPGYPDCRPAYYEAMRRVVDLGTRDDTHIALLTPLIHLDKAGIIRLGLALNAPFHLTWSCYVRDDRACGRCSSCHLRLQGFAAAGAVDPIPYAP